MRSTNWKSIFSDRFRLRIVSKYTHTHKYEENPILFVICRSVQSPVYDGIRIYFILYTCSRIFYGMTSKPKLCITCYIWTDYKVSRPYTQSHGSIQFSSSSYECTCNRVKRKLPHTRQDWITAHITIMDNFSSLHKRAKKMPPVPDVALFLLSICNFFVIFSHTSNTEMY